MTIKNVPLNNIFVGVGIAYVLGLLTIAVSDTIQLDSIKKNRRQGNTSRG